MISAQQLSVVVGSRTLLSDVTFHINAGDRIGLVGRNGAGKTTLTKVLMDEVLPASGTVMRSGTVGYLPQDPRTGDLSQTVSDRILSARNLAELNRRMRRAEAEMSSTDSKLMERGMRRYPTAEAEFIAAGGYAAQSQAASIASNLGIETDLMERPLETLSGGQRRRVELARILFEKPDTMILDEPTNHLDADSIIWLRDYLKTYEGGLMIISHDLDLIDEVVNTVFFLDATRQVIDIYSMGYRAYLKQREVDERRRRESALRQRRKRQHSMPKLIKCAPKPRKLWQPRIWHAGPTECLLASPMNGSKKKSLTCDSQRRRHAAKCH